MVTVPLQYEDFGEIVRGRTYEGCAVAPSANGDGWSAYLLYRDHIVRRDPWTIYEVNLQTCQVIPYLGQTCDTWRLVAMPDGCVYTFPEDTGGAADQLSNERKAYVARVNTRLGKLEVFGPGSPDSWNYCESWGPDWAMYVGGWRRHHAMRFDPETGSFRDYGPQGPPCRGGIYNIAADERYVYTTLGSAPFFLVACDKDTGEQQILLELNWPARALLERRPDGIFVTVEEHGSAPKEDRPAKPVLRYYRLENKKLIPIGVLPELPPEPRPVSPGGIVQPEILEDSPMCRPDGTATLWYRPDGGQWESATFRAGPSASYLFRLGTFGDGKVVGSSEDPYHVWQIAPDTGEKTVLGAPYGTHVYSFAGAAGRGYFCGYSGAPVYEWDPSRPWTYLPRTPFAPVPEATSSEANPREVVRMYRQRRAYRIVLAGDGRLYVPCSAYVESIHGGLLGWYDPKSGESGGIRDGFEKHRGHDATLACNGRYVVVSAVPWPQEVADEDARVVIFDTQEQKVTARLVPVPGRRDTAVLAECRTGIVVGRMDLNELSAEGSHQTVFFLVDVESGTVSVARRMDGTHTGKLLRLPDGRVASMQERTVLAIEPEGWKITPIGTLPATPRDWMMLGKDLFFILDTRVCRIRDFAT